MPVPILRTTPTACPHGHQLGPGLVTIGWRSCVCPSGRGRGGHIWVKRRTCEGERRTYFYEPACEFTAAQRDAEVTPFGVGIWVTLPAIT